MCWQSKPWSINKAWNESCKPLQFPSWKRYQLADSQLCLPRRVCKENWAEGTGKWPSVISCLMTFAFLALLIPFSSQKNMLCCLFPCGSIVCGCNLSVHHVLADQRPLKSRHAPLPKHPTSTNLLSLLQPFSLYTCLGPCLMWPPAHSTSQAVEQLSSHSPSCLDFCLFGGGGRGEKLICSWHFLIPCGWPQVISGWIFPPWVSNFAPSW